MARLVGNAWFQPLSTMRLAGDVMDIQPDELDSHREYLDAIRRERALLIEQIQQSRQIIERSQDLLRRIAVGWQHLRARRPDDSTSRTLGREEMTSACTLLQLIMASSSSPRKARSKQIRSNREKITLAEASRAWGARQFRVACGYCRYSFQSRQCVGRTSIRCLVAGFIQPLRTRRHGNTNACSPS